MKTLFLKLFLIFCISTIYATPYGLWKSPITAKKVAEGSTHFLTMHIDGNYSYLCEMRPENKGRYTIVRIDSAGKREDMTPSDFNVRTFVHEYGGGPFTVNQGIIYASNGADGSIYTIKPGEAPLRLTKQDETLRFADLHMSPYGLVAVTEEHLPKGVENYLSLINLKDGSIRKLASGYDFYSSPTISHDGKKIAWISWKHPNMPWMDTELWTAEFAQDGTLKNQVRIGQCQESIFEPQWSLEDILYFVTDCDKGFWNLHRFENGLIENVAPMQAEVAEPLWSFDLSTYAFLNKDIIFTYNRDGKWHLAALHTDTGKWEEIPTSGTYIHQVRSGEGFVRFLEEYSDKGESLRQLDDKPEYPLKTIYSEPTHVKEDFISIPRHIAFPSCQKRTAYGFYYPPKNMNEKPPKDEKPPLLVRIHGGPTSQAFGTFNIGVQFWTSRGFAILDVNYGGSTGYGRDYRNLLNHQWGVMDVDDAINGALFLACEGLVDKNKMAIRGGSAGGYTTLAALSCSDVFKAGASYYGISDLTALTEDTHKFESSYTDILVGKYPEEKKIWDERSPIHAVEKIKAPLILFQGENDKVVPKNQSMMIYEALKKREVPVEIYIYPGEEHGFRQAKHIIDSLEKEEAFYLKVFCLKPKCTS